MAKLTPYSRIDKTVCPWSFRIERVAGKICPAPEGDKFYCAWIPSLTGEEMCPKQVMDDCPVLYRSNGGFP